MLYKLFLKYFKFEGTHNEVLLGELKGIETVDQGLEIMKKFKWFVPSHTVEKLKEEAETFTKAEAKKIDDAKKAEDAKKLKAQQEEADAKAKADADAEKASRAGTTQN